jgi:hypothetical protein
MKFTWWRWHKCGVKGGVSCTWAWYHWYTDEMMFMWIPWGDHTSLSAIWQNDSPLSQSTYDSYKPYTSICFFSSASGPTCSICNHQFALNTRVGEKLVINLVMQFPIRKYQLSLVVMVCLSLMVVVSGMKWFSTHMALECLELELPIYMKGL